VTLAATDGAGSGVHVTQYELDGAATWTDGTTVAVTTDGVHTLAYRSIDEVGNVEATQYATIAVGADPPAPTVRVTGARAGWRQHPVRLRFTGVAAPGGLPVAGTEYRLRGGEWRQDGSVLVTRQGATLVECRAVDEFGLAGAVRRRTVRIDSRRPHVVAHDASGLAGSVVRLAYTVVDPRPGCGKALVRLVVTDAAGRVLTRSSSHPAPTNLARTIRVSARGLAPGAYRVALCAVDAAGNAQRRVTTARLTVQ
jgi:hypothetical protein